MHKKVIVAPDSFKETLSSSEVCSIICETLSEKYPSYEYESIPMADGGEGTVEALRTSLGGQTITIKVMGPNFEMVDASYLIFEDLAVIEVASVVGFQNKKENSTPANTTTYGIGQIIIDAFQRGITKIYLGLGGSITNDLGLGICSALGINFINAIGETFIPTGNTINEIKKIEKDNILFDINKIKITLLTDVDNILLGPLGATYTFSFQKGATQEMAKMLESNFIYFVANFGKGSHDELCKGSGAAGGIAYSMLTFFNAKIESGIEAVKKITNFTERICDCDYVITGEGKLDSQSINGKLISGIISSAKQARVKVIGVVGKIDGDKQAFLDYGFDQLYESNEMNKPFTEVKKTCRDDLKKVVRKIIL